MVTLYKSRSCQGRYTEIRTLAAEFIARDALPEGANLKRIFTERQLVILRSKEPRDDRRDLPRIAEFDQQVEVVGHQTVMERL